MNRRHFLRNSTALLAGLTAFPSQLFAAGWKESGTLPNLSSFGLEGTLPNLKGKVVYLDFWASWCAPCKASFPVLNKWKQQFAAKGFTVLGVSVDDTAADMQNFLKKTAANFPVVRDAAHQLVAAADVSSMPTSFLIDRKGVIRQVHNGFRPKDEDPLAAKIAALLAEA
jgi:thiol-disulfide isomerase/thioredoxin